MTHPQRPWESDTAAYRMAAHPDAIAIPGLLCSADQTIRWHMMTCALMRAHVNGFVAEFGVAHGRSLRWLAETLNLTVIHGFDSFRGLPEPWQDKVDEADEYVIPAGTFNRDGQPPEVQANVELHVGLFDETLPDFLAKEARPARLIHIDCDIYSATRTVLDALGHAGRILPGTVLVFDELWNYSAWREHEWLALVEAADAFGWRWAVREYLSTAYQAVVEIIDVET